jgi:hypothetical protein
LVVSWLAGLRVRLVGDLALWLVSRREGDNLAQVVGEDPLSVQVTERSIVVTGSFTASGRSPESLWLKRIVKLRDLLVGLHTSLRKSRSERCRTFPVFDCGTVVFG